MIYIFLTFEHEFSLFIRYGFFLKCLLIICYNISLSLQMSGQ